jgi:hypothetical protein
VSTTNNTLQGRGSGIKAQRTSAKAGGVVSLTVIEERKHWQAVTSIDGTAMLGAHPARLTRKWQLGSGGLACELGDGGLALVGMGRPQLQDGIESRVSAPTSRRKWLHGHDLFTWSDGLAVRHAQPTVHSTQLTFARRASGDWTGGLKQKTRTVTLALQPTSFY